MSLVTRGFGPGRLLVTAGLGPVLAAISAAQLGAAGTRSFDALPADRSQPVAEQVVCEAVSGEQIALATAPDGSVPVDADPRAGAVAARSRGQRAGSVGRTAPVKTDDRTDKA